LNLILLYYLILLSKKIYFDLFKLNFVYFAYEFKQIKLIWLYIIIVSNLKIIRLCLIYFLGRNRTILPIVLIISVYIFLSRNRLILCTNLYSVFYYIHNFLKCDCMTNSFKKKFIYVFKNKLYFSIYFKRKRRKYVNYKYASIYVKYKGILMNLYLISCILHTLASFHNFITYNLELGSIRRK